MILPSMLKRPSAFLPIVMSLAALATVFVHLAIFGVVRESDEGTAAHVWQLLIAAQAPIVVFFAANWLPQAPKQAVPVLALQIGAVLAALAPIARL